MLMLTRDTFESPAAGTLLASPATRASTPAGGGLSISVLLIFYNFDVLVRCLRRKNSQSNAKCSRVLEF